MNKKLKVLPILAMGLMLVACNGGTSSSSKPSSKNDEVNFTLKVGSYVALGSNANQIEVSTAAVILKEDKIVDAYFDVLQAPFKIESTSDKKDENKVTYTVSLDTTTNQTKQAGDKVIETKQELKERYAMKPNTEDAQKMEWYNQANNFAKYTVGKTIDEVTSKNYKSHYNKDGAVEVPGCTISQTNFTTALKVITDTKTFKAPAGKVSAGLGYKVSALSDNVLTVTLAGSATDKDGKIYETSINAYQIPVTVDGSSVTSPKIAIDTSKKQATVANFKDHTVASGENTYYTSVLSKRELKELYAMKENNEDAQKMEWYNQANNFAKYAKGKIASEIAGKTYKSNHNANGTVEVPGCTITMEDFAVAIGKSATNKSGLTAK